MWNYLWPGDLWHAWGTVTTCRVPERDRFALLRLAQLKRGLR